MSIESPDATTWMNKLQKSIQGNKYAEHKVRFDYSWKKTEKTTGEVNLHSSSDRYPPPADAFEIKFYEVGEKCGEMEGDDGIIYDMVHVHGEPEVLSQDLGIP